MTGLNLESFLHLLRADLGAWATLGLIAGVLALMAWTSWGSRRALRKCLVLSVLAHGGLAFYGGTSPVALLALSEGEAEEPPAPRIRNIKVTPASEVAADAPEAGGQGGRPGGGLAPWDRRFGGLALADAKLDAAPLSPDRADLVRRSAREALGASAADLETNPPEPIAPEERTSDGPSAVEAAPPAASVAPATPDEIAAPVAVGADPGLVTLPIERLRPERPTPAAEPGPGRPRASLAAPATVALDEAFRPALPPAEPRRAGPGDRLRNLTDTTPVNPADAGDVGVAAVDVIPARPETVGPVVGGPGLRERGRPSAPGFDPKPTRDPATRFAPTVALATPAVGGGAGDGDPPALSPRPGGTPADGGDPSTGAPAVALGGEDEARRGVEFLKNQVAPLPTESAPGRDVRAVARPDGSNRPAPDRRRPDPTATAPLALARVVPNGVPALPDIQGAAGGRPLGDVPEVYRSRLDPNRSARAYRSGATPASEQAVERALDWLARHQDTDGRWDGSTAKYDDGTPLKGDDDFTVHCPAGEPCTGDCIYWEADTALTGLALLAYLGAGYTQTDGKYAETVAKGLDFLRAVQKPDGDLRGQSKAVGMYCHAMASIALCEAYALTGDERLRDPVERAIGFLGRARARDGQAWRYAPGAAVGDTSILGWVVMALKSGREVGIEVPSTLQSGTLTWLARVASGDSRGLARYQPWDNVTPTMTAEAWVCRQFLGVGGPGAASTEAANYLLENGPKATEYNLYYWYYGTLAMYQHGGTAWTRWNAEVRDAIVRRQRVRGHAAGSWDPDTSPYGTKGGRIYSTALATLSLEVYYRYLRLYDEPSIPPAVAPARTRVLGSNAPAARP